jgi:hypothetical protein
MEIWAALVAERRDRESERDRVREELRRACSLYAAAADDVRQLQVQRYKRIARGNSVTTAGPHNPRTDEAVLRCPDCGMNWCS